MFTVVLNAVVGMGLEGHEGGYPWRVMGIGLMWLLEVAVGPGTRGTNSF